MAQELTCIVCPIGCRLTVTDDFVVSGNQCKRGAIFAKKELTQPMRKVTSSVTISQALYPRLPVVTDGEVPKHLIFPVMEVLQKVSVCAPVLIGDVIVENVCETGVNVIAARDMMCTDC